MYNDWDSIPRLVEEVPLQNVHIGVKKLCHITHNQPAREIDGEDYFEFKSAPKVGKGGDENTYVIRQAIDQTTPPTGETEYRPVASDENLFPGYYSWWSIDNDGHDLSPYLNDYYFSNLFTSSSRYGNNKFSANIVELLQCYKKAFNPLSHIQFRCGGTLRYKQEICKVVIVCTNEHHLPEDKFPRMWKDCVTEEEAGEITLVTSVENLEVMIRNGITGTFRQYIPYSWDTYAFAFYFPDETYTIKCPKSVIQCSKVEHDSHYCINKREGICPNDLDNKDEN